jgi:translation initiation factor 2A
MSVDISDAGAKASVSVFVRSKSGPSPAGKMVHVSATSKAADDPHLKCAPINHLARFSADGSVLGAVEADGVRVLRADGSGAVALSLPRPQVQELWLSPKGTFLLTWEKMAPTEGGEGEGNLKIWRVATGELVCSWQQKILGDRSMWPAVNWSCDEEFCYKVVTNEVHFMDGGKPTSAPTSKLRVEGVAQCTVEPTGAPHHVATFVPEKKGAPAVLRVWTHGDYGEGRFLATRSFFKADTTKMLWCPVGGALLVHTQTEVDTTGKSYMGETGLYYMPLDGKKVLNVQLKKAGPIHDVQWSPKGDEFIAVFGQSPPEACIFNRNCEVVHSFGEGPRNTVSWSPHGRFLCLAGFGNMSGELAFYDRSTTKCLGTVDAHMTVNYGWSPDSRSFLTAICFPRLRVDNGFRIWSLAGGLLHKESLEELTIAEWRPQPASLFPPPGDAELAAAPRATARAAPTSQAKKYVPPGQRAAGGGGRSLSDLAASVPGGGGPGFGAGGGRSLASLAGALESGGSAAIRGGPPPGSEPADGSASSRNAQKQKAKREAAKKKKDGEAEAATAAASAAKPAAGGGGGGGADDGPETEEKVTKKIRAVEKKLRQVAELKELKAGGKPLEKNQLDKIENEASVQAELETLQGKLKELSVQEEKDKWR